MCYGIKTMLSERNQIEKPTHIVWFHLHKLFRINWTQWSKPVIYALRRQKKRVTWVTE